VKGKHPSPRAVRINKLVKAVSAQANVFKNATQKRADYARIAEELREGALAVDPAAIIRRCMVLQTAGNTRMWSHANMFRITAEQDPFVGAYFQREDPLNSSRLTPVQRNETGYGASMLQSVAGVQKNLEAGLFVTAAAKWLGPQDVLLRNRYKTGSVERLVFILSNKEFTPKVEEVVDAIKKKRDERKKRFKEARSVAKAAAMRTGSASQAPAAVSVVPQVGDEVGVVQMSRRHLKRTSSAWISMKAAMNSIGMLFRLFWTAFTMPIHPQKKTHTS